MIYRSFRTPEPASLMRQKLLSFWSAQRRELALSEVERNLLSLQRP